MKTKLYLFLFVFALTQFSFAIQKVKYGQVTAKSGLIIRNGAGKKFKKVDLIPFNRAVKILKSSKRIMNIGGKEGYWKKVKFKKQTGWVFGAYLKDLKLKIVTLSGQFTDADRGDCFHLGFKAKSGKSWDFGDAFNLIDIAEETPDYESFVIKKKYRSKTVKLYLADLPGRVCDGTYTEKIRYRKTPTILDVHVLK